MVRFYSRLSALCALLLIFSCNQRPSSGDYSCYSPSGDIGIHFNTDDAGRPVYSVTYLNEDVIQPSNMGFDLVDGSDIDSGFTIVDVKAATMDEVWQLPWGEQREVLHHGNEMLVRLEAEGDISYSIRFRAYDDGIAFRYEFAEQDGQDTMFILDEQTEFQLTGDHTCWWIPGDWDIYEHLYGTSAFSEIDAIARRNHPALAQTYIPNNAVNTPVTMRTAEGLHLSFHEANLTDYAGMTLKINKEDLSMESALVRSDRTGYAVKRALPFNTPWRTIQISPDAAGLISSNMILNLNDENKLGEVSWFKPMKYMGIWWEMHIGKATWDFGMKQDMGTWTNDGNPHGRHGATTENTKYYIDFAAANGIGGILVEGWNTGWEHWIGFDDREGVFDFVTPYPDYDIKEVVKYAEEKGVRIIMHHETSAAPRTYEEQLDTAFALMNSLGMHTVKTGYVGKIIPEGEYHHGQWMVNHYRKVLETAAKYDVAINAHEPIKATGIRRTYPNAISREGLRGQEFNAWSPDGGNPPEHLSIVAFTRMLAGPIDFTPGAFNIKLDGFKEDNQINTTLAHQLALYVVIYSPVQMACDLPEHYEDEPAFQFIRDVGVDWEQTLVLDGEVGDFVVIAREERESENWFLGAITDEEEREIELSFDFLAPGIKYKAKVYRDGPNAHWDDNPLQIEIKELDVDESTTQSFKLAAGGGLAISIIPVD